MSKSDKSTPIETPSTPPLEPTENPTAENPTAEQPASDPAKPPKINLVPRERPQHSHELLMELARKIETSAQQTPQDCWQELGLIPDQMDQQSFTRLWYATKSGSGPQA